MKSHNIAGRACIRPKSAKRRRRRGRVSLLSGGSLYLILFLVRVAASPLLIILDIFYPRPADRMGILFPFMIFIGLSFGVMLSVSERLDAESDRIIDWLETSVSVSGGAAERYEWAVQYYSIKNGVDPDLVKAVIAQESAFNPEVVSPKGAKGLMQLMPATWSSYMSGSGCNGTHPPPADGDDCIYDPEKNIDIGTRHLKRMLDRFGGDTRLALAAYNAGEGNVERYLNDPKHKGIPPFKETQDYIIKVSTGFEANRRQGVGIYFFVTKSQRLRDIRDRSAKLTGFGILLIFIWILSSLSGLYRTG